MSDIVRPQISLVFPKPVSTVMSSIRGRRGRPPKTRTLRAFPSKSNIPRVQEKHIVRLLLTSEHIRKFREQGIFKNPSLTKRTGDPTAAKETRLITLSCTPPPPSRTLSNPLKRSQRSQSNGLPKSKSCKNLERAREQKIMRNLILNNTIVRKATKCKYYTDEVGTPVWPTKTDAWCKHCSHPFSNPPVGIPTHIDNVAGISHYFLSGNFCSFNCALAYILYCPDRRVDDTTLSAQAQQCSLLNMLCAESSGIPITEVNIIAAAPKDVLKVFTGYLTIEEYRESFIDGRVFFVYQPPVRPEINIIEEQIPTVNV